MKLSRRVVALLLAGIFVVSFFLRAYHPLSRPRQWLDRAEVFNRALDERDWEAMYRSRHPGYTVMAISGLTLRLYDAVKDTPAEWVFDWAIPDSATDYGARMAVGVVGLALVIAALIVAIALALRRLGGWPFALTAAGLLAFAPFYLSQTRVLHVDGLLATLMMLSALLLLANRQTGRWYYLLTSGLVAGLCLLTKTPSLFLVPYTGLTLLVYLIVKLRSGWADHPEKRGRWVLQATWREMIGPGLVWLLVAVATFVVLWPAMWVEPAEALTGMFLGTEQHVLNPHVNPRFFAGQIYYREHPSVLFYPVTIAFNETFLTLPLVVLALGHYTIWRRRVQLPLPPIVFWLLVAYAFFFTTQMTIGAKQVDRYILPTHLSLAILAAVGLFGLINLVTQTLVDRNNRVLTALPAILAGLTVGLQALVSLPYAPDYGAHHNYLLGGNRTAVNVVEVLGQNEGILDVLDYVNSQPDSEALQLGMTPSIKYSVRQYFSGEFVDGTPPGMDYYIFSLLAIQRRFAIGQWEGTWDALRVNPAVLVVSYDGVDHTWLFAAEPDPATQTIRIRRGWTGFIGVAWLWTLALVVMLVWAFRRVAEARPSDMPRLPLGSREWALILLILLVGFGLRVGRFLDAPPGIIHDEVRNWYNAQLLLGGDIRALYPYGGGREAFYIFLEAVSFRLLGDNLLAARLPSIVFSMIGIAASFSLTRRLFGRGAGVVTAAGMATSFWALMFARLAVRPGVMPVLATLLAYLYLRILQDKHPPLWRYMLAVVVLGVTLYTYPAALIFPVILAAWFGLMGLVKKAWLRGKWLQLGLSFVVAGIIAIPLIRAWSDPAVAARAREVNAPFEALLAGDINPVLANVKPVLGIFSVQGDHGLEFNVEDQPLFPTLPMAILFYVGVGWAVWGLFDSADERRPGYVLALLWLVLLLIPTLATERPVNPYRTIGLLGIVYAFPAIAAAAVERFARRSGRTWVAIGIGLFVALGVILQLVHTNRNYFTTWVDNPVVRFLYQDEYRILAADLDARSDSSPVAVGGLTPDEMDPASMRLLMADDAQADTLGFFDPQTALLIPHAASQSGTIYVIVPGFVTLHPALAARLDQWGLHPDPPYDGVPYARYALSGEPVNRLATGNPVAKFHAPGDTSGQPVIALLSLEPVGEAVAGSGFSLLTIWRPSQAYPVPLRIFVHLTDEDGNIIAQSDVLGVPAPGWRGGDLIIQAHDFFLPADAPAGPYLVNVGLYDPASGVRLTTPGLSTGDHLRWPLP